LKRYSLHSVTVRAVGTLLYECAPRHGDLHTHRGGEGNLLFDR
jgi:hypothetical protein